MKDVLEGCKTLSKEELTEASGGNGDPEGEGNDIEPIKVSVCGDNCEYVKAENVSSDFATGRITGADFFA